jgi:hypothetical protein
MRYEPEGTNLASKVTFRAKAQPNRKSAIVALQSSIGRFGRARLTIVDQRLLSAEVRPVPLRTSNPEL